MGQKKIASIGLRIKRGFSYHGVSLNIDMNLTPFNYINTCGVESLEVTQINDLTAVSVQKVKQDLEDQRIDIFEEELSIKEERKNSLYWQ